MGLVSERREITVQLHVQVTCLDMGPHFRVLPPFPISPAMPLSNPGPATLLGFRCSNFTCQRVNDRCIAWFKSACDWLGSTLCST